MTSAKSTDFLKDSQEPKVLPMSECVNGYGTMNTHARHTGLMCELLWSDPQPENGRGASKRGVGIQFGPDVTKRFLEHNGLGMSIAWCCMRA